MIPTSLPGDLFGYLAGTALGLMMIVRLAMGPVIHRARQHADWRAARKASHR